MLGSRVRGSRVRGSRVLGSRVRGSRGRRQYKVPEFRGRDAGSLEDFDNLAVCAEIVMPEPEKRRPTLLPGLVMGQPALMSHDMPQLGR